MTGISIDDLYLNYWFNKVPVAWLQQINARRANSEYISQ